MLRAIKDSERRGFYALWKITGLFGGGGEGEGRRMH